MSQSFTPEIESILDQFAEICVETMRDGETLDRERCTQLAKSLSTNGWKRHSTDAAPINVLVKNRAKAQDADATMHHHKRLGALCDEIESICKASLRGSVPESERALSDRNDLQAQSPRTGTQ